MLTRKENKCSEQGPREQEELERCQENRLRQDLSSSESSHVIKTKEKKGKSSVPLRNPRFDWTRKPLALSHHPLFLRAAGLKLFSPMGQERQASPAFGDSNEAPARIYCFTLYIIHSLQRGHGRAPSFVLPNSAMPELRAELAGGPPRRRTKTTKKTSQRAVFGSRPRYRQCLR